MAFTLKRGSGSKNTKETAKREESKRPACLYVCILLFWSSIDPSVGGPVRKGALQRVCYSGLSSNEGLGRAGLRAVIFGIIIRFWETVHLPLP